MMADSGWVALALGIGCRSPNLRGEPGVVSRFQTCSGGRATSKEGKGCFS
uniref:Uncharacterized protein n=1 Tax=Kalanchoe fedtschenkoi TaxID=63787 RepID=A0A7N0VG40_KALFE